MTSETKQQSIDAYRYMQESGKLNDEQEFVYAKLRRYGPATGMELHRQLAIEEGNRKCQLKGPERVRKRLPELADQDLIVRKGSRKCRVTGREATVWEVRGDN